MSCVMYSALSLNFVLGELRFRKAIQFIIIIIIVVIMIMIMMIIIRIISIISICYYY